jgi:hypothetical protein
VSAAKLTEAQRKALAHTANGTSENGWTGYLRTFDALARRGLVEWCAGAREYRITPAGRAALNAEMK